MNTSTVMKLFFGFFIILFFLEGCTSSRQETGKTFSMQQLTEKEWTVSEPAVLKYPRYIALQTSSEEDEISMVDKVIISGDKIYVADKMMKKLVVFDSNGIAIAKIGEKGHGPGEYIDISDFSLDEAGNLFLLDNRALNLLKYAPTGELVESRKLPFQTDAFQCLPEGKFLFSLPAVSKGENAGCHLLLMDRHLNKEKEICRYESFTDENFRLSGFGFNETDKGIFYHKPIDDHIYQFDKAGNLIQVFHFDFGNKRVPESAKKEVENKIENEYMHYTTLTYFTIVGEKQIYLSLFDQGEYKQAIIDRPSRTIYKKSDESLDLYGHLTGASHSYLIAYIPNIFEGNIPDTYPKELQKALQKGNHILCLYDIKENL